MLFVDSGVLCPLLSGRHGAEHLRAAAVLDTQRDRIVPDQRISFQANQKTFYCNCLPRWSCAQNWVVRLWPCASLALQRNIRNQRSAHPDMNDKADLSIANNIQVSA